MTRYIIITTLCLFLFFSADAQKKKRNKLTGQWTGIVTQEREGEESIEYKFEVYLTQDGKEIEGQSYVEYEDIFARMKLTGTIRSKRSVTLTEIEIFDSKKTKDLEWCMKKCHLLLKYDGTDMILEGFWFGNSVIGACTPGKVILKKSIPRA